MYQHPNHSNERAVTRDLKSPVPLILSHLITSKHDYTEKILYKFVVFKDRLDDLILQA